MWLRMNPFKMNRVQKCMTRGAYHAHKKCTFSYKTIIRGAIFQRSNKSRKITGILPFFKKNRQFFGLEIPNSKFWDHDLKVSSFHDPKNHQIQSMLARNFEFFQIAWLKSAIRSLKSHNSMIFPKNWKILNPKKHRNWTGDSGANVKIMGVVAPP